MSSKLHGTFAAVLMSSAIVFAGASVAATSADTSGSGGANIDAIKSAIGNTKTSTPNKVANVSRAARARVERKEQDITRELNRASAASSGNANASTQATIGQPTAPAINEAGAPVANTPSSTPLPPVNESGPATSDIPANGAANGETPR